MYQMKTHIWSHSYKNNNNNNNDNNNNNYFIDWYVFIGWTFYDNEWCIKNA